MVLLKQQEAAKAKQAASEYDIAKILEMWQTNSLPPELQIQTQHSVYCEEWLWVAAFGAAKRRGKSRPQAIREFLFSLISEHEPEIPKLKAQIEDMRSQMDSIQVLMNAKIQILNQLIKEESAVVQEQSQKILAKEQAVLETSDLIQLFGSRLSGEHYNRMSALSGKPVPEIKKFLKDERFRPTEQKIREFYME